jgi:hypothetical protein
VLCNHHLFIVPKCLHHLKSKPQGWQSGSSGRVPLTPIPKKCTFVLDFFHLTCFNIYHVTYLSTSFLLFCLDIKYTVLTILKLKFSAISYIHIVVKPILLFISRTFSWSQTEMLYSLNNNSSGLVKWLR